MRLWGWSSDSLLQRVPACACRRRRRMRDAQPPNFSPHGTVWQEFSGCELNAANGSPRNRFQLEFESATYEFDQVEVRTNSGGTTVHDEANARADKSEKYATKASGLGFS